MNSCTPAEQAVIDAQGWNDASVASVLANWAPGTKTRLDHFRAVAAIENGGDSNLTDQGYLTVYQTAEDVPALLNDGELVGKTIGDIDYAQIPGPSGFAPGIVLHFTDGTAHTVTQPGVE